MSPIITVADTRGTNEYPGMFDKGVRVRVLVVINSGSGGSDSGLYAFVRLLGEAGTEVVLRYTTEDKRLEDLLGDATSFDRIVAAGGDGTASTVCYVTRDTGIPVLTYPSGTANLLASNLGLPMEPRALAAIALEGEGVSFDLGELEHRAPDGTTRLSGFVIMAGAGYDAAIMEAAQPLKSTFGAAAYLLAAVTNLTPTSSRFELTLDGEHVSTDGIAVLLVNFGRLQFDVPVAHNADPRDGRLEIAVVRTKNVVGLLPAVAAAVFEKVSPHPDRSPGVDFYSASRVEISAYPPLRTQYDGEVLEEFTPFAARALPGAATLLVGPDGEYSTGPEGPAEG